MYDIDLLTTGKPKRKPRIFSAIVWTFLFAIPIGTGVYVGSEYWSTQCRIQVAQSQLAKIDSDLEQWRDDINFIDQTNATIASSNIILTELRVHIDRQIQWTPILIDMVQKLPEPMTMEELYVSRVSEFIKTEEKNVLTGKNEREVFNRSLQSSLICPTNKGSDHDIQLYIKKLWLSDTLGQCVRDIRMTSLQEGQTGGVDCSRYDIECLLKSEGAHNE